MHPSPSIEAPWHVRPATQADRARIQALVRGLTPRTRYLRFLNGVQELSQAWLERFSRADPRSAFTLLAIARETGDAVGMAQYGPDPYPTRADFAVVVADRFQRLGIGKRLVCGLLSIARASGLKRMEADVLAENRSSIELLQRLGFRLQRDAETGLVLHASTELASQPADFTCNAAVAR
jgi:acetyltransferase